jgi:hypothetical protein
VIHLISFKFSIPHLRGAFFILFFGGENMKQCPYNFQIEQVNENTYEYNDDNLNISHTHKLLEKRNRLPCIEEECGAFYDGHCHYNAE